MRALTQSLGQAKQVLASVALLQDYVPDNEAESISALVQTMGAIHANQHQYRVLLACYHQVAETRSQLLSGVPESADHLLNPLSRPFIARQLSAQSPIAARLRDALRFLKRQGLAYCPPDPRHPVHQQQYRRFKQSHAALFSRYQTLLQVLRESQRTTPFSFFLDQLEASCHRFEQLTSELEQIDTLITIRYNQQMALYQELKNRLKAIKNRVRSLKLPQRPATRQPATVDLSPGHGKRKDQIVPSSARRPTALSAGTPPGK